MDFVLCYLLFVPGRDSVVLVIRWYMVAVIYGTSQLVLKFCVVAITGSDLARGNPGNQLKLGLTKTVINNARQLSRSLVGIYH